MANVTETARWDTGVYQIEKSDKVLGGADGKVNVQAQQLANRTAYLKKEVETKANKTDLTTGLNGKANSSHTHTMANITDLSAAMNAKANLASPTFTGAPKAPTPAQTVNDTTLATTAFVKAAIAALVGSAPAALDTLAEIATALGADGNLKNTLLTEIGKKANQTDFTTLKNLLIGIPFPYPLAAVPSGCLAFNGQTFNKTTYPILAQKYPSGVLPDLRGEFIRGWDNGRGVDAGRGLLSAQGDAIRNIKGYIKNIAYQDLSLIGVTGFEVFYNDINYRDQVSAFYDDNSSSSGVSNTKRAERGDFIGFDASRTVPTANENRPRNIAFQYICLAV